MSETKRLTVNGRSYNLPDRPVVFVCLDGTSPEYLEAAAGVMPNLRKMIESGTSGTAMSVIPSFTNPNNMAIVTGVPPSENGISANFYYDRRDNREVMMNDATFLRCPTVLSAFAGAGRSVAVVTTKEKLRKLLGKDLDGICFSVELAHETTFEENGIRNVVDKIGRKNPGIYDPECSVYCIEAGDWLMRTARPDFLYLSTTDFVQHKFAPETEEAKAFYSRIDHFLGRIHEQGVLVGITADHGMNDKTREDGSPRVEYLESILQESGFTEPRVILPITDPYVVHHGALGSFATVYLRPEEVDRAAERLRSIPGVELVLSNSEAADRFSLPPDRIGDLVVLGDRHTVLGRTPDWHDLSAVGKGLRSHGGLHERVVPFILNRPLSARFGKRLDTGEVNNYDLLDYLCNGIEE